MYVLNYTKLGIKPKTLLYFKQKPHKDDLHRSKNTVILYLAI